jgi:YjbE family integral membrane protein
MIDLISTEVLVTFLQVVMIDLVLAGDNAIVIGLAAAGLPQQQRTRAILVGIVAATALRILFAGITTQLLQIIGLLLAGGILLLWVCWKMWRELRTSPAEPQEAAEELVSYDINAEAT